MNCQFRSNPDFLKPFESFLKQLNLCVFGKCIFVLYMQNHIYKNNLSFWWILHFLVSHHQLPQRLLSSFKYWRSLRENNFKSTKTSGEITFRLADVTEHWRTSAKWINQCYGTLKRLWEIVLDTKQKLIFSFLVQYSHTSIIFKPTNRIMQWSS